MKILYVDLEREWRGGQSQALLTLRGLKDKGQHVELLAAHRAPLAERSRTAGIIVHSVPRLGLRAWAANKLHGLVSGSKFDLVHLNEPHALAAAWLAKSHHKLPLLFSRRIGFPLKKNRVSQALYRAVECFVANSRDVAQSLVDSGISEERISIVNEGVEIAPLPTSEHRAKARKHWGIKDDEFVFGCVSVFVPEKGQRHLIEAFPKVRAIHPEARLFLAGDGECRQELETLAKHLSQQDAVYFPGFVRNVDEVYAALDAFTFPSEFEGLGTALQTAMAAAIPSISTARGALGEVVDDQRTALVVEPNAGEFAEAMLRLIEDAELRSKLGQAAREEIIARFSSDSMVANTMRVYEEVLSKRAEG
ncbi:MAG: glycosyltransferase family 4 protein [Candidatus Acidiferrum sp.]